MIRREGSETGQARVKSRRARKRKTGEKQELRHKTLFDLTNKTNWQQTNREHRYKYSGENGENGRHLEGGGDKHKDR